MLMEYRMPKAYSYTRFSTPEQASGDSERRQLADAQAFAARHGLTLDTSLSFVDRGVSGFRGRNAAEGALAAFKRAVEDGEVAPESWLIVENLDRLSRNVPRKAMRILEDIVELGITVGTANDGQVYDEARLDSDPMAFMVAYMVAMRAHEESKTKARRLSEAWKAKRTRGADEPLTAKCPAWLTLSADRSGFNPIPERAAVVLRVFTEAAQGVGGHTIAANLNAEGVPVFGNGARWHRSYIKKILDNEAVVGIFTPHTVDADRVGRKTRTPQTPIPDYFPAVVPVELWETVKAMRGTVGRRASPEVASIKNPFAGIARCAKCGAALTRVNKGAKGGHTKLACTAKRSKAGCDAADIRLDAAWTFFKRIAPDVGMQVAATDDELNLANLDRTIRDLRGRADRLVDEIARNPSLTIRNRLADYERELVAAEAAYRVKLATFVVPETTREKNRQALIDACNADDFAAAANAARLLGLKFTMSAGKTYPIIEFDMPRRA
jgi:DNA invertase Pin-like site-specific DNA recombinase